MAWSCAGCGANLPYRRAEYEVAPGVRLDLCPGRSTGSAYHSPLPRRACVVKALAQHGDVCPGCGEQMFRSRSCAVCNDCRNALALAKMTRETGEQTWWLDTTMVLDAADRSAMSYEGRNAWRYESLAHAVCAVAGPRPERVPRAPGGFGGWEDGAKPVPGGGRRNGRSGGCPVFVATEEQARSIAPLVALVSSMFVAAYQAGHRAGRALLAGLAAGELTPAAFDGAVKGVDTCDT